MTSVLSRRRSHAALPCCLILLAAAGLMASTAHSGENGGTPEGSDLQEKADEIRAAASELFKLRRIPWITDPAEGFRIAKEENRPIFFYMQAGDPLEDC